VAPLLEEALALKPRIKNRSTIAHTLVFAALDALLLRQDWDETVALHDEALVLFREMDDRWGLGLCLTNLGLIVAALGHHTRATTLLRELMHLSQETADRFANQYAFFGLACVADSEGRTLRAARLWGVSEAIREAAGFRLPHAALSVMEYESRLAAVRARLGEATFEEAWAEGKVMTTEQAVEYALSEKEYNAPSAPTSERPPAAEPMGNLTRREQEVAVLVARGLTNRQISTELGISERTAGNHVARILRKLGFRSRVQIASWTTERKLLASEPE
jgi:non-specific serine/threonine protein kinase